MSTATTITDREPEGVCAGGQFRSPSLGEPTGNLDRGVRQLQDSRGGHIGVTPGVIDSDARYVYKNGQCLALAVALAERTGWPIFLRQGDLEDDSEPHFLYHAWVKDPAGNLVDIDGLNDAEALADEWEDEDLFTEIPAVDARATLKAYESTLSAQDLTVAEAFVDPVLEMWEDDI